MAKKAIKDETTVYGAKFAVLYSDNETFGIYNTLEEATAAAVEDLESGCGDETNFTICLLVPKRTVQATHVVVTDV